MKENASGFSSCGGIVLLLVIWRPVGMPATSIKQVGIWITYKVSLLLAFPSVNDPTSERHHMLVRSSF